jgi:hydrogenase-1 operon protein HyaE
MRHPLIARLLEDYGYPEVTLENHEEIVGRPGVTVLFFAGNPKRYRETTDVAVVLPELAAATGGVLQPAVVTTEAEIPLQKVYGFRAWPSLVFTRPEGYLGRISRMKDWSEYLEQLDDILRAVPHSPPGFDRPTPPPRGEQGVQTEVR